MGQSQYRQGTRLDLRSKCGQKTKMIQAKIQTPKRMIAIERIGSGSINLQNAFQWPSAAAVRERGSHACLDDQQDDPNVRATQPEDRDVVRRPSATTRPKGCVHGLRNRHCDMGHIPSVRKGNRNDGTGVATGDRFRALPHCSTSDAP